MTNPASIEESAKIADPKKEDWPCNHSAFEGSGAHAADGYVWERSLLNLAVVEEAKDLLWASQVNLNRRLEEWLGEAVADDAAFARHQARLAEYELRGIPKDLRHYLVGEFDLQTRLDPRICRILGSPSARKCLARLLDSPRYYVHFPPMIRLKVAEAPGSILPAHQDFPYNTHLRDFLTVWVPLVDIDQEVGGLILYPGSHLDGKMDHAANGPWAHGLSDGALLKKYARRAIQMKVGDALIFPPTLIHESAAQLSRTTPRLSIDFRVFREPSDTGKSYYDPFEDRVTRLD